MWWKCLEKVLIENSVSSEYVLKKHPDKVADWIPNAVLAGRGMNHDEVFHYYPYSEDDHLKQIIARSNCSFEIDFRKFLKSRYVKNRVIRVDTWAPHNQFHHTVIIPPLTQLIKSVYEIPIPHTINGHSQLLQRKSNGCIIVTMRPGANQPHYIKNARKEVYIGSSFFKTFKTESLSLHPELLNKEQIYLAVVRFTGKYMTMYTKHPYSHIDIYSISDKKNASKLVARFEDGDELTVSANS